MDLRIGFIEPHLRQYGGVRRVVELSNALIERGHDVTAYVPEEEPLTCDWIRFHGRIRHLADGFGDQLDVVVFNDERQWWLLEHFEHAHLRVFYALHYSRLYGKAGSWECLRAPVDLTMANSAWTADRIAEELGVRPPVVLGGINPDHFRPVDVRKTYEVLAAGDRRPWKGTEVILDACQHLEVEPTFYGGKGLRQSEMAREYSAAEVFVVGSDFEGFGQPGLEALACGVPLVTTDNGGCREYAIDGETALVVPPRDPHAMAEAIARLRTDRELARSLRAAGLELVRERFDWSVSAEAFERVVGAARPDPSRRPRPVLRGSAPVLSVVVLQWDQMHLTQRCVDSIRYHTDVPYELIIVDNGSGWDARSYAQQAADRFLGNVTNLGFGVGMNQGLSEARGEWVALVNNDTVLPEGWASTLLDAAGTTDAAGIVCPAVTAAGNPRSIRTEPGDLVETLFPFERTPSAVLWLMPTATARALGGFGEEYPIASAEDLDLAYKVWTNGLDILLDQRVLIDHVGHGTSDVKLDDRRRLWAANRERFLDKWEDIGSEIPRIGLLDETSFNRSRAAAAGAAANLRREFELRDRANHHKARAREKQAEINKLRERIADHRSKVANQSAKLKERQRQLTDLRARLADRDRDVAALRDRLDQSGAEIESLKERLGAADPSVDGATSRSPEAREPRRRLGIIYHSRIAHRAWMAVRWAIPERIRRRLVRRVRGAVTPPGSGPHG